MTRRQKRLCTLCGRYRHLSCPACGKRQLTRDAGGHLVDHDTCDRHNCYAPSGVSGGIVFPAIDPATVKAVKAATASVGAQAEDNEATRLKAAVTAASGEGNGIADAIFESLRDRLGAALDHDEIKRAAEDAARDAAKDEIARGGAVTITVQAPNEPPKDVGRQHHAFRELLTLMGTRQPVWLVGPAGSGKTVSVQKAAEALGLNFHPKSVGPATTEHALFGYMDATGEYIPGVMHKPFVDGGVLLLDEIDSAHPDALTTLNTALANDYASFPHRVEKRHPDCVIVAAGNTIGHGADRQYVGRAQLDAATLDRFCVLRWEYDETFERSLARGYAKAYPDVADSILAWCERIHILRRVGKKLNARIVFSTRAIVQGAILLGAGVQPSRMAELVIWEAADPSAAAKIKADVGGAS